MCTALNNRVWGIDYITSQPTVPKFGQQIDTVKFICNHFCSLPDLQNLNVMETEDQNVQLVEYALQLHESCEK